MTNQEAHAIAFDNTEIAYKHKDLPALKRAYLLFKLLSYRGLVTVGTPMLNVAMTLKLPVEGLIRRTIFGHFCGGESIEACDRVIAQLGELHVGTILDYSVESGDSEADFDHTCSEIIRTIEYAANNRSIPFAVVKVTGLGNFEVLEKVSASQTLTDRESEAFAKLESRFYRICEAAYQRDIPLLVDAEHSWIQQTIDTLTMEAMRRYNRARAIIYNTYQLYRHDKLKALKADEEQARTGGFNLGAKIVRGAYMEKERHRAMSMGYQSPIHINKEAVDNDFNAAARFCLENIDHIGLVVGSHNEDSCLKVVSQMEALGISNDHPSVYFSQLLGMCDHISLNLAHANYNVAKYMPYGPVRHVMPYLLRRAQENSSVSGQSGRERSLLKREIDRRKK